MEKNRNNTETNNVSNNYDLKSKAVDDLVNADSGETPKYSQEELNKYRSRSKIRISETVKVVFLKVWFPGAVCYFILWGLGMYISSLIDMLFVLGVALGMVTDLLENNVIRFIEKTPGANDKWLMVTKKGTPGFFLNLLYAFPILICVFMFYNVINTVLMAITGAVDTVPLGVEPVFFGVFYMAFDMLFIGAKHLLQKIIADARKTA